GGGRAPEDGRADARDRGRSRDPHDPPVRALDAAGKACGAHRRDDGLAAAALRIRAMTAPSRPGSESTTTLGDLLRQKGVAVGSGEPPASAADPAPAPSTERLDIGGARKIVLRRERKGRGGKTVTVVGGAKLPPSGPAALA